MWGEFPCPADSGAHTFLRWEVAEGREPSWQTALTFCPPCRLPGKLSEEGVGYMAELQDIEWNSDTKGEDKSSVLSLGRGGGTHGRAWWQLGLIQRQWLA